MDSTSSEARARKRAKYLTDLLWHTGAFVILNAFFWVIDWITDDRITWAYWITLGWGFALAFHALAWFIDGRDIEDTKTTAYLAEWELHDRDRSSV